MITLGGDAEVREYIGGCVGWLVVVGWIGLGCWCGLGGWGVDMIDRSTD